ncbi:lysozyme inhibitor LprI family protein [Carnimonas bestiolae]|uniref:lysozyme inhibitor LprI family protein n=1 Tax=Carnimonas bestiolae TaxID=3402172 RepID=UPI003EDCA726
MRMVSGRALLTVAGLALSIGVVTPNAAASSPVKSDSKEAVPHSTSEQIVTFHLSCPGNRQTTTPEVEGCFGTKIDQVKAVQDKYISAIQKRIADLGDNADSVKETQQAFDAENKAWDALIDKASNASYQHWSGGTIRGTAYRSRMLALMELRVHEQWEGWLKMVSRSDTPMLPEPRFEER